MDKPKTASLNIYQFRAGLFSILLTKFVLFVWCKPCLSDLFKYFNISVEYLDPVN